MTLAATLCTDDIAGVISAGEAGAFMHGPTFMANPLACATAIASIELLLSQPWQRTVQRLNEELAAGLAPAAELQNVRDVRTLGAIGVIELEESVDMRAVQPLFVERGVWVRPFGRLVYCMPPFIMNATDTANLTAAMVDVVAAIQ
jgi:adenosylmethionine-8-amino-7-oxononanoate aminotransferase